MGGRQMKKYRWSKVWYFTFIGAIVLTLISMGMIEFTKIYITKEAAKCGLGKNFSDKIPHPFIPALSGLIIGIIFSGLQKLYLRKNIDLLVDLRCNSSWLSRFRGRWLSNRFYLLMFAFLGLIYIFIIITKDYHILNYFYIPTPIAALIPHILIYPEEKKIYLMIEEKKKTKER